MSPIRFVIPSSLLLVGSLACGSSPKDPDAGPSSPGVPLVGAAQAAPTPPPAAVLDPSRGSEIGLTVEAFLSPHQEPGEEDAAPRGTPKQFLSTTPSKNRNEREAAGHRGHGIVRFTKDLSRAYVDVALEGVEVDTIDMFHIHCGKPGILGPILVDFAHATDLKENFGSGTFTVEITNADVVATSGHGHGVVAAFANGCVIPSPSLGGVKPTKVSTVAGVAQLAAAGELYFNLHTTGQMYYGDVRGQMAPVE